jgi:hypothetical protein
MSRRYAAVGVGLALYVAVMGFLGGMLAERVRFDVERGSILRRVAFAEQRLHAHLMELERAGLASAGAPAAPRAPGNADRP